MDGPLPRLLKVVRASYRLRYLLATLVLLYLLVVTMFVLRRSIAALEAGGLSSLALDHNPLKALGLSWLLSTLLLGGSPVAAIIVGLAESGNLDPLSTIFGMMGTRLGAVSFVFFIGAFLLLRGRGLRSGMGIGIVSFIVSSVMALSVLAMALLFQGLLRMDVPIVPVPAYTAIPFVDWAVDIVLGSLGPLYSLIFSLACIVVLMDRIEKMFHLRDIEDKDHKIIRPLFKNPLSSFALGFILTGIFFSVSVTFALLVPLYEAKRVRRGWAVPYIIAANISTFIDTYLIALSGGNRQTIDLVIFCILASAITGLLLMLKIDEFSEKVVSLSDRLLENTWGFSLVLLAMIALPVLLSLL